MKTYGYARVSAKDQNLARQLDSFKRLGIPRQNIYAEKSSGKDFCPYRVSETARRFAKR